MDSVWLEVVTGSVKCQDWGDLSATDQGTWLLSPGGWWGEGVGGLSKESCDGSFPVSAT